MVIYVSEYLASLQLQLVQQWNLRGEYQNKTQSLLLINNNRQVFGWFSKKILKGGFKSEKKV